MEGRLFQDWVTIATSGTEKIVQGEPFWLEVSKYRDIMAWLDVRQVNKSGGFNVELTYQTAPACDEQLFTTVGGPVPFTANTVTVTQMLGSIQAPPLAKYVRWVVSAPGGVGGTWDATFRVLVALNRPGYRTPIYMLRPSEQANVHEGTSAIAQQGSYNGDSMLLSPMIKNKY